MPSFFSSAEHPAALIDFSGCGCVLSMFENQAVDLQLMLHSNSGDKEQLTSFKYKNMQNTLLLGHRLLNVLRPMHTLIPMFVSYGCDIAMPQLGLLTCTCHMLCFIYFTMLSSLYLSRMLISVFTNASAIFRTCLICDFCKSDMF